MDNRGRILYLVLFIFGLIAPAVIYPIFLMKALCFALFASAFNLLLGYTGLLSFGHAMFLGTAGYITGHAAKVWGFPTELSILAGVAASAALGYVVGALAIRRQGIYFAMITLAFSQMLYFIYLQAPFRQTFLGLVNLDDDNAMYYFTYGIVVLGFWLIYRTIHSPFGQVLKAIRENEARALSLGYDVDKYKLLAFVLSCALSGLAGATKALVFKFETLTDVHWAMSGEAVLMTLLGGMGTILGPTVGAFIVVTLQNYLASLEGWVTVITGVIFVLCVLLFRRGVVGEIAARIRKT
jgi:branched-chain amino acid transport system permease protein